MHACIYIYYALCNAASSLASYASISELGAAASEEGYTRVSDLLVQSLQVCESHAVYIPPKECHHLHERDP